MGKVIRKNTVSLDNLNVAEFLASKEPHNLAYELPDSNSMLGGGFLENELLSIALQTITKKQKTILELFFYYGYSVNQIADYCYYPLLLYHSTKKLP